MFKLLKNTTLITILVFMVNLNAQIDGEDFTLFDSPYIDSNRLYSIGEIGDYIDPFTGTLKISQVDLSIPGNGGLELNIIRLYSSRQDYHGSKQSSKIGLDWRLHFGRVIRGSNSGCSTDSILFFETQEGSLSEFAYNTSIKAYLSKNKWKMICNSGGVAGYTVYAPNGTQYLANLTNDAKSFYVSKITDKNDNWIQIEGEIGAIGAINYSDYKINEITTSDNRELLFYYSNDSIPQLTRIRDVNGNRSWLYKYQKGLDEYNTSYSLLTEVERPDGKSWLYSYNDRNDNDGRFSLNQIITPLQAKVSYTYGKKAFKSNGSKTTTVITKRVLSGSNLSTSTNQYSYTATKSGDITTISYSSGKKNIYKHYGYSSTSNGTAWKIGLPYEVSIYQGSSILEKKTYKYDKVSLSNRDYTSRFLNGLKRSDSYTYASIIDSVTIERDTGTYETTYNYSTTDQKILNLPSSVIETGTNSTKKTTYFKYNIDKSKWLFNTSEEKISGIGTIISKFDRNGNMTSKNEFGYTTGYIYHNTGDLYKVTDPRGNTSEFSNYKNGIARKYRRPDRKNTYTEVNNYGLVSSKTDAEGYKTRYYYDSLNRLTSIYPPLGDRLTISYSGTRVITERGGAKVTEYTDTLGRVITRTLSGVETLTKKYRYDTEGRMTFASLVNSSKGTNYSYDVLDRTTRICSPIGCSSYSYNSRDNVKITDANGNTAYKTYMTYGDPDKKHLVKVRSGNTNFEINLKRNALGLITSISSGGIVKNYDYGTGMYLTSITEPETGKTSFIRDGNGNITKKTQSGKSTYYTYNNLNKLTKVTYPSPDGTINYSYDDNGNTISIDKRTNRADGVNSLYKMNYDKVNRLTSETKTIMGKNFTISYDYNDTDNLERITYPSGTRINYSPDNWGRPRKVEGYVTNIKYFFDGKVKQYTYGNGIRTEFKEDDAGRVISINADNIVWHQITYDDVSNPITIKDNINDIAQKITYDGDNRLISDKIDQSNYAIYTYDSLNNITSKKTANGTQNYYYNNKNQLSEIRGNSEFLYYDYDGYGNIIDDSKHTYAYSNKGNMIALDDNIYSYDSNYQRIAKESGDELSYFIYDNNGRLIAEYNLDGILNKEYYYLGSQAVAQKNLINNKDPVIFKKTIPSSRKNNNIKTNGGSYETIK